METAEELEVSILFQLLNLQHLALHERSSERGLDISVGSLSAAVKG